MKFSFSRVAVPEVWCTEKHTIRIQNTNLNFSDGIKRECILFTLAEDGVGYKKYIFYTFDRCVSPS